MRLKMAEQKIRDGFTMSITRKGDAFETVISPARPSVDVKETDPDWPRFKAWLDLGYMVVEQTDKDEKMPEAPKHTQTDTAGKPAFMTREELSKLHKDQLDVLAVKHGIKTQGMTIVELRSSIIKAQGRA